jgi:hypothetical protein
VDKLDGSVRNNPLFHAECGKLITGKNILAGEVWANDTIGDIDKWLNGKSFHLEGSTFLRCPWLLAANVALANDANLKLPIKVTAARNAAHLLQRLVCEGIPECNATYQLAEMIYCAESCK